MIEEKAHVLVDTNVILEAHRIDCWNVLTKRYKMNTVWRCVEECETGNQRTRNSIHVNIESLKKYHQPQNRK